ncbi:MAG TPA: hypothetical protein V6D14_08660 [Coleofasciculaceae cyanobacterium]
MLINSQKLSYRRWTTCLVLLSVLAITSCTKKPNDPTAGNSSSQPTAQSTSPATSATPAASSTAKTTTNSSKSSKTTAKTLSPEAQKLGTKPTGTDCPTNAPIKGNLNKKGKQIYHESKAASYKNVKPEICFADVSTAKKAGFVAPGEAK